MSAQFSVYEGTGDLFVHAVIFVRLLNWYKIPSLARKKAKEKRTLAQTPGFAS